MADTNQSQTLDGYIRVSRVAGREGESFISPDVQREQIEAFATGAGYSIGEFFTDLDESGGKRNRPQLDRALAKIERGESGGLVVAKLDRLARSILFLWQIIEQIEQAGAVFLSAADRVDTGSPHSRFTLNVFGAMAQFERERMQESWKVARKRAVDRGVHVASRTPTGYSKGDDGRLVPHPVAAPAIAEVFQRRAAGVGLKALATILNEAGVVGPYGSPNWTASAVSKILANPVYRGEARSGEYVNLDAHPAIVTLAEWTAAQHPRPTTTPRRDGSVLAGILRCAGCGYVMKADYMKMRDGSKARIYRCRGDHAAGKCPAPSAVLGRVIEPFVAEAIFSTGLFTALCVLDDAVSLDAESLLRDVEIAERNLSEYLDSDLAGVIGAKRFREGAEKRKTALDQTKAALKAASVAIEGDRLGFERGAESVENARTLWFGEHADGAPFLSTGQKREIVARLVDAVALERAAVRGQGAIEDRAWIYFRGEGPSDLPGRGKRVGLRTLSRPNPFSAEVVSLEDQRREIAV